ncbi:hypothetical protein [Burkholderia sp. ISTR5]|uniref:hypothetical protein n=1 Tax=Burkholderia sp. ISTR5 TaxID=2500161 RepID=UPI001370F381|nr:hypothetical protein [Burkholderia sp. ISTR5]NBI48187.1 hypothetical protein [Burkholderia sp. ISTR5]
MLAGYQARIAQGRESRFEIEREWMLTASVRAEREQQRLSYLETLAQEHGWPSAFKRVVFYGAYAYSPLAEECYRGVKIRTADLARLRKVHGIRATGWIRDAESGAIRAEKNSQRAKTDGHQSQWFDVAALLLGLKDGESYAMPDPYDLTTIVGNPERTVMSQART